MKKCKTIASVMLCSGLVLASSVSVNSTAYLCPYGDLVDSGKHLDWDYDTAYYSECKNAQTLWNGHKSGVIREDAWNVIEDIFVTDYYSSSDGTLGYTDFTNDKIAFNNYYFASGKTQSLTAAQRRKTAAHEFGHALGCDENNHGSEAIMRQGRYSYSSLHKDDKDSFDAAYKKY